jgi:hypothetical protein
MFKRKKKKEVNNFSNENSKKVEIDININDISYQLHLFMKQSEYKEGDYIIYAIDYSLEITNNDDWNCLVDYINKNNINIGWYVGDKLKYNYYDTIKSYYNKKITILLYKAYNNDKTDDNVNIFFRLKGIDKVLPTKYTLSISCD